MGSMSPKQIVFDTAWSDLKPTVINIINLQPISKLSWDHKFTDVYDICLAFPVPQSERLYKALVDCIKEHVADLKKKISDMAPEELLKSYNSLWSVYYRGAMFVHNLFGYLNNLLIKNSRFLDADSSAQYRKFLRNPEYKGVECMVLGIWMETLAKPLMDKLIMLILAAVERDRSGQSLDDRSIVHGVIMSFVQVEQFYSACDSDHVPQATDLAMDNKKEFYENQFERKFLESTEIYYSNLGQDMMSSMSCSAYMEKVITTIENERTRAEAYVHQSSIEKIITISQNVMISAHREKLDYVCHDITKNEDRKDLRNMYKLLKPIPCGLSVMVKEFEEHIRKKGFESISTLTGDNMPHQFVENILQVYDKYNQMKCEVFLDDGEFRGALDKALQSVVSQRTESGANGFIRAASESLARYVDGILRKSSRDLTDNELDNRLSRTIIIFRYVEDKDVFQKFYAKMLSARLLHGLSVSMEAEELMINKLRHACGYEFTYKFSRMFTDLRLSSELNDQFNQYLTEQNNEHKTAMQPLVLTAGSWPLSVPSVGGSGTPGNHADSIAFSLPQEMKRCADEFETFYMSKHSGRRLSWLHHTSHGELRTNYLDKQYVIQMSVFQMAVLMAFNVHTSYKVADLSASTGLVGDLILKLVKSVVAGNMVGCSDKEPTMESIVSLYTTMSNRRLRFKLPSIQSTKQAEKGPESVKHAVAQDRKYYIECTVVRIMKTRKVLKHVQLISEVMEQIKGRFKPEVCLVKKCIEDLIDKMYLQRTEASDEYQYLA